MTTALIIFSIIGWTAAIYSLTFQRRKAIYWKKMYITTDLALRQSVKRINVMLSNMAHASKRDMEKSPKDHKGVPVSEAVTTPRTGKPDRTKRKGQRF